MEPMSRRRAAITILSVFITAYLILFFAEKPSIRAPPVIPDSGDENVGKVEKPVFVEPDNGSFRWSQIKSQHPVENLISLPTGRGHPIPKIQHRFLGSSESREDRDIRIGRLDTVKQEFLHAWNGYKKHAWLSDEVAPLSGEPRSDFGGWAATLIDALDTLWIMDLKDEFEEAVQAIRKIDFTSCSLDELNVFETTVRYLGGLPAAYDLSSNEFLLQKAWELGNMLYVAFDTPNRMPVTRWDFKAASKGQPQMALDNTLVAEIGSLTLEFTRLAQVTKDDRFYDAVQRIMDVFEKQQEQTKVPGLWPVIVNAKSMDFTDHNWFTLGGMADSLYEYLPKQHLLVGGAVNQSRQLFERAAVAIKRHMLH